MSGSEKKKRPVSTSAVVRIVIWSVVLCMLSGLYACSMGGAALGNLKMPHWVMGPISYRYDEPETYKVGDATIKETVTSLDIDWVAGHIRIISDPEATEVTVRERYASDSDVDEDTRLRWRVKDGKLTVKHCRSGLWMWRSYPEKDLTVTLPAAMAEALGTVTVDTVEGNVSFAANAESLTLNCVEAIAEITGRIDDLDVDVVDGGITVRGEIGKATVAAVDARVIMHLDRANEIKLDCVDVDMTLHLSPNIKGFSATAEGLGRELVTEGFEDVTDMERNGKRWGNGSLAISVEGVDVSLAIKRMPEE